MIRRAIAAGAIAVVLGAASVSAGDPPPTIADCEERIRHAPDRLEAYRCFIVAASGPERRQRAILRLTAMRAADPLDPYPTAMLAVLFSRGGGGDADALFRESIARLDGTGPREHAAFVRVLYADRLLDLGKREEARRAVDGARAIADELAEPSVTAMVGLAEARLRSAQGEYERAEAILDGIEPVVFADPHPQPRSWWLSQKAYVCWATSRLDEAESLYRRQLALIDASGEHHREGAIRYNLALIHSNDLSSPPAREQVLALRKELVEALRAASAYGNVGIEIAVRVGMAELEMGREDWVGTTVAAGRESLFHARRMAFRAGRVDDFLWATRTLARSLVFHAPHDRDRGLALYEEAVERALYLGRPFHVARGRIPLADALLQIAAENGWSDPDRERAIAAVDHALAAIEQLRDLQDDRLVRARTFSSWAFAYRRAAVRMLDAYDATGDVEDLRRAFAISERMRARELLDALDASGASASGTPPPSLARDWQVRHDGVLAAVAAVRDELARRDVDLARRADLVLELDRLAGDLAALRLERAAIDPGYAAARAVDVPTIEAVGDALDPGEAFLSFLFHDAPDAGAPGSIRAIVQTVDSTAVYRLPLPDDFDATIDVLHGMIAIRDGSDAAALAALHGALLDRILADAGDGLDHLVIGPDGPLFRIPFAALRSDPSAPPLGASIRVTVVPSAATWLRLRSIDPPAGRERVAVFADPDRSERASAAYRRGNGTALDEVPAEVWGRLPWSRREARDIAAQGLPATVYLGPRASIPTLRRATADAPAVLHFATHALTDHRRPDRSAIVLTARDGDDGMLRMRDIVDLDLAGAVVVLSACDGATGTALEGEGPMSLARGFFVAGARTVVGSLWPLQDRDARAFFGPFYAALADGASVGDAARRARARAIADGAPTAAWAGIVVAGDGSPVPFRDGLARGRTRPSVYWAGLIVIVFAVVQIARVTVRRRFG